MAKRSSSSNEEISQIDPARIAFLEAKLADFRLELDRRFANQSNLTELSIDAIERTIHVAQETANRAVMKAEAAAERAYLETNIESLRRTFEAQITAQKNALDAALVASTGALNAALNASEKAISKADIANEKRFESINEFRGQMADQQRTLVTQTEVNFRFIAVDKALDADQLWQRRIELKLSEYVTIQQSDRRHEALAEWRRSVDEKLTAAESKSGLIYSIIAMTISLGVLIVAVYNLFTKMPS
jgi:hypothetical protein